ncbi:hypothetical protein OE88DRAFT_1667661 [Heliocybe sulcata]|uniref:Zn(2)-C6 fungal-type domain-containing protein n=1 Tax=Heliocybe sulcata TaxID=5364 RepID=A0A5C3MQK4_9AGAM|nr:hypothetical protein OE88DRAFT_1667661 [Heliocybe sulcata]
MGPAPKTTSVLQRGSACLPCRKKKMRCEGTRPTCSQCAKSLQPQSCIYEDAKKKSRTQSLKDKVAVLEKRLKELEPHETTGETQIGIGSSPQPFPPPISPDGTELSQGWFSGPSGEDWFSHDAALLSCPTVLTPPYATNAARDVTVNDVVPPETKCMLLDIFLSHHQPLGFHVDLSKLKSSLSDDSNGSTHPALINAIHLLGCQLSQSIPLLELRPHFLERALQSLGDGIESSDNLLHLIQASCLLSLYFFAHCRLLEAYKHAACAATMVASLAIHRRKTKSAAIVSLTPETDLPECLAAFWQSFVLCYTFAGLMGLPALGMHAIEARDIEKPVIAAIIPPFTNSENQIFAEADAWSIPSLYGLFLRARVTALYHRSCLVALQISGPEYTPPPIEQELDQLLACLPPTPCDNRPSMETFTVLALGNATRINLYKNVPGQCHDRCRDAAFAMTFATELLRDEDYIHIDPVVIACMAIAARVFLMLRLEEEPPCIRGYHESLQVLMTALRRLGLLFPLATFYADSVHKEWIERAGKVPPPFAPVTISVVDLLQ